MWSVWSSRGREMSEPDDGPYIRSKRVRISGDLGYKTKKTAFVMEPETFWIFIPCGVMAGSDQEGTRKVLMHASNCTANLSVL